MVANGYRGDASLMKTCMKCSKALPLESFRRNCKSKDGRQGSCRTCANERDRIYSLLHKENKAVYDKIYRAENPERVTALKRSWNKKNREKENARKAIWKKAHPENTRANDQLRRARKLGATVEPIPNNIMAILIAFYGNKCMFPDCKKKNLSLDHIVPLAKGGTHGVSNFQILCISHNSSKAHYHSTDYRPYPRLTLEYEVM